MNYYNNVILQRELYKLVLIHDEETGGHYRDNKFIEHIVKCGEKLDFVLGEGGSFRTWFLE